MLDLSCAMISISPESLAEEFKDDPYELAMLLKHLMKRLDDEAMDTVGLELGDADSEKVAEWLRHFAHVLEHGALPD